MRALEAPTAVCSRGLVAFRAHLVGLVLPASEYDFVHHFLEYTTWEQGLSELAKAADRLSALHRVNWR